jgi:hypothetical protein
MSISSPPAVAKPAKEPEVIIYGHSWLLYWWPVWVVGYLIALLTWLHPVELEIGGTQVVFSSRTGLGLVYCLVLLVTILITNTYMRGLVSLMVVVCVGFLALLFAYLNWWSYIMNWFGQQAVFMDMGIYLFLSTGLLLLWLLVVGLFDHLSFWRIQAGQVTH